MTKTTIYCPDIECDSCVKVISRTLSKMDGVDNFNVSKDHIDIEFNESKIKKENIRDAIIKKGYRADFDQFTRRSFKERWRDFVENKKKYKTEYTMFSYSAYMLLILIFLQSLIYFIFKNTVSVFYLRYWIWLLYLDIFVISIAAALWHFKSYKTNVTGMLGMMVGMTFGMQSGFMLGTLFGATNGMFIGSMVGMFVGFILGFYTGKCCGIMGSLQGMMAGLMGGVMGGMTGVMMSVDNIQLFMPFFAIFNLFIMWGLSLLLYEDMIEDNPKLEKNNLSFAKFALFTVIFVVILVLIIIYGPKSGVAGLVGG